MTADTTISRADTHINNIPQPSWTLSGTLLTPTHAALQAHAARMQHQSTTDPLITISLHAPGQVHTITIHESLLRASPQLSSITEQKNLQENLDSFMIIRKFLYLQPINVAETPVDAAVTALRWGLKGLHDALYSLCGEPRRWLGLMTGDTASDNFKREFVRRFVGAVDRDPTLLSGGFGDGAVDLRKGVIPTWPVLRKQGIVVDVVRALIRFGDRDYGARILDVVMRGFEVIGEDDVKEVLEALEWESGYGDVIDACGSFWSGDAWKVLIDVRDRVRFGWDEIRLSLEGGEGRLEKGKEVVVNGKRVRFVLGVESGKKGMGVSVRTMGEIDTSLGRKRVRVRVSVGGVCACEDDGVDVVAQEEVSLNAFGRIGGVGVRVLDVAGLQDFVGKHRRCRMRVCVRLLLLRDVHFERQVGDVVLWGMMCN